MTYLFSLADVADPIKFSILVKFYMIPGMFLCYFFFIKTKYLLPLSPRTGIPLESRDEVTTYSYI